MKRSRKCLKYLVLDSGGQLRLLPGYFVLVSRLDTGLIYIKVAKWSHLPIRATQTSEVPAPGTLTQRGSSFLDQPTNYLDPSLKEASRVS